MEWIFQWIGALVTLAAVAIGLRAIIAAVWSKPPRSRLRVQPIQAAVVPGVGPAHRRRRRQHRQQETDPLEEIVTLLFLAPVYVGHLVQTARQTAQLWRHEIMSPVTTPSTEKAAPQAAETLRNATETPETAAPSVSTSDIIELDQQPTTEQVMIETIAKLLKAQVIKSETRALEAAFEVKAGGGKEYQRLRTLLKAALGETDAEQPSVAFTQSEPPVPIGDTTETRVALSS